MTPKEQNERDIPKSLQGIELVLRYLGTRKNRETSIRNISNSTELSTRVVKNVLLQLEKFNQVERIYDKNNVVPKWKITSFGKRVIKEANGGNIPNKESSIQEELLQDIILPANLDDLKTQTLMRRENILAELGAISVDLSKSLGPILNLNQPHLEDIIGFIIKRLKVIRERISNLPDDPMKIYKMEKLGTKPRKISKKESQSLLLEIFFIESLIRNDIKRITNLDSELTQLIENKAILKLNLLARELRNEIRQLTNLVNKRESLSIDSHLLNEDELGQLAKNKLTSDLLDNIITITPTDEAIYEGIKEHVLKIITMLQKGKRFIEDHNFRLSEYIPLYFLYQLILDDKPDLIFSIEQLEDVLNDLSESGYLIGIKSIIDDENEEFKVVQLMIHDLKEDEIQLTKIVVNLQKLTLADAINSTGWAKEKCLNLLKNLTELGILKYSKSYLHGELWYVISEQV